MLLHEWLKLTTRQLQQAGIATARLDCLVLLGDELERDKSWLLSHSEHELQGSVLKKLSTKVTQRVRHIPLAYIRGHTEFYGLEFAVNAHTLVPRPETETMIEVLKDLLFRHPGLDPGSSQKSSAEGTNYSPGFRLAGRNDKGGRHAVQDDAGMTLLDIGTGSGAIAITAKLELPQAHVIASDIDQECLKIARQNAKTLGANITFLHGNLLEPFRNSQFATRDSKLFLLCNLPYIPNDFQINTAATHEPRRALFGGPDGLDLYRQLFEQTNSLVTKPLYILTESLPTQHKALAALAKAAGYHLEQTSDFILLFTA